jgi:hypothetical protein
MAINKLNKVPYDDFKLLEVIDPQHFDTNNATLVTKIDEIIDDVNTKVATIIDLTNTVNTNETDIENKFTTLSNTVVANETDIENKVSIHKTSTVLDHPDASVTTVKIADSAVTTQKINNGAITLDKLDSSIATQVGLGEVNAKIITLENEVKNSISHANMPLSNVASTVSYDVKVDGGIDFEFDAQPLFVNSFTGDRSALFELYPAVTRLLGWFSQFIDQDGLLANVPGWPFIDWGDVDKEGESTAINSFYYKALRRAEHMALALNRGADAGEKKRHQDHPEADCIAEGQKSDAGDERAEGEKVPLAKALREKPGWDLKRGHRSAMGGSDQPDLRQRQPESLGEQRQQNVSDVGKAVVQRVGRAARGKRAARFADGLQCLAACRTYQSGQAA